MSKCFYFAFLFLSLVLVSCEDESSKQGTPEGQLTVQVPVVTSTTPPGPANNNSPIVNGTANKLVLVKLYSDSTCSTQIGIGNTTGDGSFSVSATVADNVTTTIYAKAFNGSYSSECSTTFVSYTELSTAGANQVVFTSTNPVSPGESLTPRISGTATANSTVELYTTADCSGPAAFTGTASAQGNFAIDVSVSAISTTTFKGLAVVPGLTSLCSTSSITYQNVDLTAPAMPVVSGILPVGPANNNNPVISGTGEAGTTVRFYRNAACSTVVTGTAVVPVSGNFSVSLTVPDNTNYNIYARLTDGGGNNSPCSTTFINYVEDTTAPLAPVFSDTNPVSPSNSQTPFLNGNTEANATVNIYTTTNCSGPAAYTTQANSSGVFTTQVNVGINTINKFYATATDVAGNIGVCTTSPSTYVMQANLTIPIMPVFNAFDPISPSDHNNPTLSGESEADMTINIYTTSNCSGGAVATTTADSSGVFTVAVPSSDNTTTNYYAKAINQSLQESPCTTSSIPYTTYTIPEGVAWLYSSTTTSAPSAPTNINQTTMRSLLWAVSEFHSTYYSHSRTTNTHQLRVKVAGDYLVAANLPYYVNGTAAIRMDVRVNGTSMGVGRSNNGFIGSQSAHRNSSAHIMTVLSLNANDIVDIGVIRAGGTTATTVSGTASLMVEYIDNARNIFFASSVATTNSSNLNQSTSYPLSWTSLISDGIYSLSSGDITLNSNGHYLAAINVPLQSTVAGANVKLLVKLNGLLLPNGVASKGYTAGSPHTTASLTWYGVIPNVTSGDILTVETVEEGRTGSVATPVAALLSQATIFLEQIGSSGLFMSRGTNLSGGTNWNIAAPGQSVLWENDDIIDGGYYSHSTVSNAHQVTLNTEGDYFLMLNAPFTSATQYVNIVNRVRVGGADVSGTEAKSSYISNAYNNNESSNVLSFLLRRRAPGSVVDITSTLGSVAGTVTSNGDASIILRYRPNSVTP